MGPQLGLGTTNGDGLPALPPPRVAEAFRERSKVLRVGERELFGQAWGEREERRQRGKAQQFPPLSSHVVASSPGSLGL